MSIVSLLGIILRMKNEGSWEKKKKERKKMEFSFLFFLSGESNQ